MKTSAILSLLCLLVLGAPLRAEDNPPLSAAVLDFQTTGDAFTGKGSEVAILLNAQLSQSPVLMLVERQDLEKVLSEQELGLSGTVTPDTAAKLGALTGAKILVTGRLFDSGGKYFLVAKVMSTETSRVYGATATFTDPAGMESAVKELTGKITELVNKNSSTLVAKSETPAAQIERLKKSVAGKTLPSVSIAVTEQHLRHAVIDPAVETELTTALQQIGFTVIDAKSSNQVPDVRITGEAFSELGTRFGNLVSCRARVEIKATKTADNKLLFADRQTEAGVDLAEDIAAKKALENAARKLLDRIVPQLAK